jgi:hypothetical protein
MNAARGRDRCTISAFSRSGRPSENQCRISYRAPESRGSIFTYEDADMRRRIRGMPVNNGTAR